MLPSQASMIFSIAISVCLEAILNPLRLRPRAVSAANWGQILGSARTFGGIAEFPQLATLGRHERPCRSGYAPCGLLRRAHSKWHRMATLAIAAKKHHTEMKASQ